MFESLKKKFSRTSEKLEEELIEEAEAEDNLQEESGSRFSFFSFGRKKDEKKEEEVVEEEENLLPEAEEIEEVPERTSPLKKLRMKRLKRNLKRKRNPTSGAGTRTRMKMKRTFLPTARQKAEYSHLYVKKPFRKNTLKTFSLNLKWNSCRVTLQWRSQQRLWKTSRKTL